MQEKLYGVWEAFSAQPGGDQHAREALRQSGRPLAHSQEGTTMQEKLYGVWEALSAQP
ncbi:hypothetical protein DPMN_168147 [Dreissena polymorpha]|uniref:Uncharacterized protein n=1 Tax=Dreissena polymorpha TaxID=45954 RepID=A0A9D4F045_DREPO|nr:hypothetical protein DPMN_168147 [Dreissena polymorpha]